MRNQSRPSEKQREKVLFMLMIVFSVFISSSMLGRLDSFRVDGFGDDSILVSNVHSGPWDVVPMYETRSRVYIVENPTEYPLRLVLKAENFVPVASSIMVGVNWNFSEELLLPNEIVEIEITLENYCQDYDLFLGLDLYVLGLIADNP